MVLDSVRVLVLDMLVRGAAGCGEEDSDGPEEVTRPGQWWDVTGVERVGREAAAEGEEDRYTPSPNADVSGWARPDHRSPSLYQTVPLRPCGCDNPRELYCYYGRLAAPNSGGQVLGGW